MRTSPVYYIAPSAISITPNANNSHRDLAIYVAKGAKIKVRCPRAGIGMDKDTSTYQEWTLEGRNRRLADVTGTVPYTIYARLKKAGEKTGYLVFAKKTLRGNEWTDAYSSLTLDNNSTDGYSVLYTDNGFGVKIKHPDYYYVRLGDVSDAENGLRTVTLDTGILGTDDYNDNWAQNPDDLPLRIELGCTVDNEDVGLNPYVYWDQSIVLTATLMEGWAGTDIQHFDHWKILRKTDDNPSDSGWLDSIRDAAFRTSGEIVLSHGRDSDDFNGAVATTFTIMAMGLPETSNSSDSSGSSDSLSSEETEFVVLKTAAITILAETIERYELALSANIVVYKPQTKTYDPVSITARVRATDQRGNVFELTKGQFDSAGLAVEYAAVGSSTWTQLAFSGANNEIATASLTTDTAFAAQQSLNVRMARIIEEGSSNSDSSSSGEPTVIELMQQTIAFVRDGEDSREREWIYTRRTAATTFSGSSGPDALPSLITLGEVNPSGVANGTTAYDDAIDEWVPEGWTDEPQDIDENTPYEYGSYRDYIHESDSSSSSSSSNGGGHWGAFSTPTIWNRYGKDGVTYDIVPSVGVINADAEGAVRPSAIEVRAYKTVGTERSSLSFSSASPITQGGTLLPYYYVEYCIDGGSWATCGTWTESYGSGAFSEQIEKYGVPSSVVEDATDSIAFRLKHSSDTSIVLKEIPPIKVVKDGAAPYNVYAYARYDSREADATTGAPTGSIDSDAGWGSQAPAPTSAYPYVWQRIQHYTSAGVNDETSYVCLTGATGSNGHTGRFYYYAGEYNQNGIYRIESTQAPYVKFTGPDDNDDTQTGFFMLDNGGTEPLGATWPSDGHPAGPSFKTNVNSPWTQMQSQHQYYIARAFFGDNAYLGSFIINGDWMISQYGTYKPDANTTIAVNSTNISTYPSAYTNFKSADPLATGSASGTPTYPCFAPNFAVNGLTGKTYQNDVYVSGEVHATSGEFTGEVKAKRFSSLFMDLTDKYTYDGTSYNAINGSAGNPGSYVIGQPVYRKSGNEYFLVDTEGVLNFTVGATEVLLPKDSAYISQRVILFNPNIDTAGSTSEGVTVGAYDIDWIDDDYTSSIGYLRGIGAEVQNSGNNVPSNHVLPANSSAPVWSFSPVEKIYFVNGTVEVMAVPDSRDESSCEWAVINIGTNCYLLLST